MSGTSSHEESTRPITVALRWPREASGRSWSDPYEASQSDLAWRMSKMVFTTPAYEFGRNVGRARPSLPVVPEPSTLLLFLGAWPGPSIWGWG